MNIFQSPYPELLPLPTERFEAIAPVFEEVKMKPAELSPLPSVSSINPNDYLANLILCVDILYDSDPDLISDSQPVHHVGLELLMSYPFNDNVMGEVMTKSTTQGNKKAIAEIARKILSYCSGGPRAKKRLDAEFDRRRISTAMSVLRELGVISVDRQGSLKRIKRQEALLAHLPEWGHTLNRVKSLINHPDVMEAPPVNEAPKSFDNDENESDHQKVMNDIMWFNEQITYNTFST